MLKTPATIPEERRSRLYACSKARTTFLPPKMAAGSPGVLWKNQTATPAGAPEVSRKDPWGRGGSPVHFLCPRQLACLGKRKSMLYSYQPVGLVPRPTSRKDTQRHQPPLEGQPGSFPYSVLTFLVVCAHDRKRERINVGNQCINKSPLSDPPHTSMAPPLCPPCPRYPLGSQFIFLCIRPLYTSLPVRL